MALRWIAAHGESTFEGMCAHFEEYTDVVGDHPSNMVATGLGRVVALHHRSSASCRNHQRIRCLFFWSGSAAAPSGRDDTRPERLRAHGGGAVQGARAPGGEAISTLSLFPFCTENQQGDTQGG